MEPNHRNGMATKRKIQPFVYTDKQNCKYIFTAENAFLHESVAKIKQSRSTIAGQNYNEYKIWCGIKTRCTNPKDARFSKYGGRGISLCERWHKFENFLSDMGRRPSKSHSVDRIDNDGNYSLENCRWATASEQQRNQRRTSFATVDGITRSAMDWSELTGVPVHSIIYRLKVGWPDEAAVYAKPCKIRRAA